MVRAEPGPQSILRGPIAALALLALTLALACESASHPSVSAARIVPKASTNGLDQLSRRVAFDLIQAQHRLARDLASPRKHVERKCPDNRLATEPASHVLLLRSVDARIEPKHLLPMQLIAGTTHDGGLHRVREQFEDPSETVDLGLPGRLRGPESALLAQKELVKHGEQRYLGAFWILHYQKPDLIYRLGAPRKEWVAGQVVSWLVIHDRVAGEPLCEVSVTASNDTRDAPISSRLRSDTRERLERELAEELLTSARRRLPRITAVLRLPEGDPRH